MELDNILDKINENNYQDVINYINSKYINKYKIESHIINNNIENIKDDLKNISLNHIMNKYRLDDVQLRLNLHEKYIDMLYDIKLNKKDKQLGDLFCCKQCNKCLNPLLLINEKTYKYYDKIDDLLKASRIHLCKY